MRLLLRARGLRAAEDGDEYTEDSDPGFVVLVLEARSRLRKASFSQFQRLHCTTSQGAPPVPHSHAPRTLVAQL